MLDKALVEQKLAFLIEHLDKLAPLATGTLEEYAADLLKRHAVERLIELVVGYATDVNQLIVEGAGRPAPQDYFNSFVVVRDLGLLPADLALRLANTTGLRNRLVHLYEEISQEAVYHSLKPLAQDYWQYIMSINDYLHRIP